MDLSDFEIYSYSYMRILEFSLAHRTDKQLRCKGALRAPPLNVGQACQHRGGRGGMDGGRRRRFTINEPGIINGVGPVTNVG